MVIPFCPIRAKKKAFQGFRPGRLLDYTLRLSQGVGGMAGFVYFTHTIAIVPLSAAAQTAGEAIKWLCLLLKLECHVCVI
jgi:hypothetical protein